MSEDVSSGAISPVTETKESAASGVASTQTAASEFASIVPPSPNLLAHPSEELLEQYCLGRLVDPELGRAEEHLLRCPECCGRVADLDDYLVAMKAGLEEVATLESHSSISPSPEPIRPIAMPVTSVVPNTRDSRTEFTGFLKIAAVVVFAFSATVAWNTRQKNMPVAEASVSLVALRGGDQALPTVAAGRPVRLDVDPSTLPEANAYRAELVDVLGREMWSGTAALADQRLSFHTGKRLTAGDYWIRLYSAGEGDGELLREFSLRVH